MGRVNGPQVSRIGDALPSGRKTAIKTAYTNFAEATEKFRDAEIVHVHEELAWGVWRDVGIYRLVGFSYSRSGSRIAFRFRLERVQRSQVQDHLTFHSPHASVTLER